MMYKCRSCGRVFAEDEIPTTKDLCPTDKGTQVVYVSEDCCPSCGSYKYDEVYKCPICGEWEATTEDEPCERCADEIDYYVANCMASIITWLPNVNKENVVDYIEESMWRLTKNEDDIKYLNRVLEDKKNGNDKR